VTLINVSKDLVPLATQDQVWRPHTERLFINKPSRINISIHETWFFVYKRRTLKNRKLEDRAERTVEFWNKQFLTDDETVKEWFIDAQLTTQLVIPHLKPTSKVLIIGCGLSNLGPCLYDAGYRFITSTDISDVAIDAMRTEHQIKRPEMVWAMGDATRMQDTMLDASFDVILDKGVSDTILFRHNQKEGKFFIQELYNEVYRVLKPDGKYLVFSPRRKFVKALLWT
jgi:SAM-dependent methyltransferase